MMNSVTSTDAEGKLTGVEALIYGDAIQNSSGPFESVDPKISFFSSNVNSIIDNYLCYHCQLKYIGYMIRTILPSS